MSERGSKLGDFLSGLILGGIAGYITALLSAPRTGDETRQMLQEQSRQIRERAAGTVQTAVDKTGKIVTEGRARVEDTLESTRNQARERVSDLQNRGTDVVTNVRGQVSNKLRGAADSLDPTTGEGSDNTTPQI